MKRLTFVILVCLAAALRGGWMREDDQGQRHGAVVSGETLTWDGQPVPSRDR